MSNVKRIITLLLTISLLITTQPFNTAMAAEVPQMTDKLEFGNTSDETSHGLSVKGASAQDSIISDVGDVQKTFSVRRMQGVNSQISFNMKVDGTLPVTLEIQEIHNRSEKAFGYSVIVEGTEVYFRSYDEASSGPNHYFVNIPTTLTQSKASISVAFENYGSSRINFGKIWAYSDFDSIMNRENVYRKMNVGLLQKNTSFTFRDYNNDLQLILDLKSRHNKAYNLFNSTLGMAFEIHYMQINQDELQRRINYLFSLSKDSGMPLYLNLNSWWEGTPIFSPDGQGGNFGDVKYQQVIYDPITGEYRRSNPNAFGNTPWLTMNDENFNQIRNDKLQKISQFISQQIALRKAQGDEIPPVSIFMENEPIYWPEYSLNISPDASGDFSPSAIASAAAVGVTLNPADGLSSVERKWLYDNLTNYIASEADSIAAGLGKNAVIVDNGTVTLPNYNIVENTYSQGLVYAGYPLKEERQAKWENNLVNDVRFGGEYLDDSDVRYIDYIAARGKYANVNFEAGGFTSLNGLRSMYTAGADNVILFNASSNSDQMLENSDISTSSVFTPIPYGKVFFENDFNNMDSLNIADPIISVTNCSRVPFNDSYVLGQTSYSNYGEITYKFENDGQPFYTGLSMVLNGVVQNETNPNCKIEVWAGTSQSGMQLRQTITHLDFRTEVDLSSVALNQTQVYVQLRLFSSSDGYGNWTKVRNVKACIPWSKPTGHINGFNYTIQQKRTQNIWVGYRADVERLLAEYLKKGTTDTYYNQALVQYNAGNYVSAYNLLNCRISELLPAQYSIKGNGQLGKYPLAVTLSQGTNSAVLRLTSYNANRQVDFEFYSEQTQTAQVKWSGLTNGLYYKIISTGANRYSILQTTNDSPEAVEVVNNNVTFNNVSISAKKDKVLPTSLSGLFMGYSEDSIEVAFQDPSVGENCAYYRIPLAENVVIKRGIDGASDEQMLDIPGQCIQFAERVDLTLDSQGKATAIKAYYGEEDGNVQTINQVSVLGTADNGSVTMQQSGNTYNFKGWSVLPSLTKTKENYNAIPIGQIGPQPGAACRLIYSPYTYNGSAKSVLRLSENYSSLVYDNFDSLIDSAWKSNAYEYGNLKCQFLDTYCREMVLTTDNKASPGFVTYKVNDASGFTNVKLEFSGRAIENTSNGMNFYGSTDNQNWTWLAEFKTTTPSSGLNDIHSVDISSYAQGKTKMYIKCVVFSNNDTWGALNSFRITSKDSGFKTLNSATLSIDKSILQVGDTTHLKLNVFNDDGSKDYDGKIIYVIDNEDAAEVEKTRVYNGGNYFIANELTARGSGTANITAYITRGAEMVKTNTITVMISNLPPVTLKDENYEVSQDSQWQANAYSYNNLTLRPLDGYNPQKGLAPQNLSQTGTVIYKIDSMDTNGFKRLELDYTARGIMGGYVKVYAGKTTDNMSLLATVENDNNWTENRHIDLTDFSTFTNSVYVKFEIYATTGDYTWGYLGGIKFTETLFP